MKVKRNEILWCKLKENAVIPTKRDEDAGYDIYAYFDENYINIKPNQTILVPTGIACALNPMYYMQIEERGSTGSLGIKKSAGVIDSGYRGEIFIALTNTNSVPVGIVKSSFEEEYLSKYSTKTKTPIVYSYQKAICQGVIHKVPKLKSKIVDYDTFKKYTSERDTQKIGESGK